VFFETLRETGAINMTVTHEQNATTCKELLQKVQEWRRTSWPPITVLKGRGLRIHHSNDLKAALNKDTKAIVQAFRQDFKFISAELQHGFDKLGFKIPKPHLKRAKPTPNIDLQEDRERVRLKNLLGWCEEKLLERQFRQDAINKLAAMSATLAETPTERSDAPRGQRKLSVNARMLETMQQNPESHGWSAFRWSEHLKCAKSSVASTQTWRELALVRERLKAERAADRRTNGRTQRANRTR
jgi:hypothetical protein